MKNGRRSNKPAPINIPVEKGSDTITVFMKGFISQASASPFAFDG